MSDQKETQIKYYTQEQVDDIMNKVRESTSREVKKTIEKELARNHKKDEARKIYKKIGKKEYFNDFIKLNEDLLELDDLEKEIEKRLEKSLYKKDVEPMDDVQKKLLEPDKDSQPAKEKDIYDLSEFFKPNE